MGVFKELDPEIHLKLIEGYKDELGPARNSDEAFYELHRKCLRCGEGMQKELDPRITWRDGAIVPKALLRCRNCGFLIEPFTGVVLESGNPAKIPQPALPGWKER